jgi:outer membrane immunogenic protein
VRKFVLLLAGLWFSGSAMAASPTASMAYNWTGFYAGLNFGYGLGSRSASSTPNDPVSAFFFGTDGGQPPSTSFSSRGALGGFQLGYNSQLNTDWLVGAETDFNFSSLNGSTSSQGLITLAPGIPFTSNVGEQINWFGTIRARLGYLPTSNLLTYVTGGFAYGRVARTGIYTNNSGTGFAVNNGTFEISCGGLQNCFSGSSSGVEGGWTAGGGFDYAVSTNVILRAEYLYVNLGNKSVTEITNPNGGLIPSTFNANVGHTYFNIGRLGLMLRL